MAPCPPGALEREAAPIVRETVVLGTGYLAYVLGRILLRAPLGRAALDAGRIVDVEHQLGIAWEPSLQRLVLHSETAVHAFNATYAYLYFPSVIGVLLWLYLADRANYRLMRDSLAVSAVLALALIALFPAAPPRLLPGFGVADTAARCRECR